MSLQSIARWVVLFACACAPLASANAEPKTVCTITVNSADEREVLKRTLPADQFTFVELVERGRPDWLASACRRNVRCDALVISGHFDGGTEFYTDRVDRSEYLPVTEMERVACSDSCPGLFSQLKEVYLFGCNTLNTQPTRTASPEVARSLARAGHSPADAERIARLLADRYGESNRERMRHIFKDVPLIYGFPHQAPLGVYAGPILEKYLRSGGEIAQGRPSPKLLAAFAATAMTVTSGMTDADPRAGFRADMCQFADDRLSGARKLSFLHEILRRDMAEVRLFLDHIERYQATVAAAQTAAAAPALQAIAEDDAARARYLAFARDADDPAVRVRMAALARQWGWLSVDEERSLLVDMLGERLASDVGAADVNLACTLNKDGALDAWRARIALSPQQATRPAQAAVLACLGSSESRAHVLRAWASARDADVAMAEAYLSHRPLTDAAELRTVTAEVARMTGPDAQVRALHALARHQLADRDAVRTLVELFAQAKSVTAQRAIAGVLIRADVQAVALPGLAQALRKQRLKSPDGEDAIDVLIRRLERAAAP